MLCVSAKSCVKHWHNKLCTPTKKAVEAPSGGQAVLPVHAQVPLPHHVGVIAGLPQELRQQLLLKWNTVWLARPDDLVLHACVDLQQQGRTVSKQCMFLVVL